MSSNIHNVDYFPKDSLYLNFHSSKYHLDTANVNPNCKSIFIQIQPLSPEECNMFFKQLDARRQAESQIPFFNYVDNIKVESNNERLLLEGQECNAFIMRPSSTRNQIVVYSKNGVLNTRFLLCKDPSTNQVYIQLEDCSIGAIEFITEQGWAIQSDQSNTYYLTIDQFKIFCISFFKVQNFNFKNFNKEFFVTQIKKTEASALYSTNLSSEEEKKRVTEHPAFRNCSAEKADVLLKGLLPGVFLLRISGTEMNSFVLSLVSKDKSIAHYRFQLLGNKILVNSEFYEGTHDQLQEDPMLFEKEPNDNVLRTTNQGFIDHLYRLGIVTSPLKDRILRDDLKVLHNLKELVNNQNFSNIEITISALSSSMHAHLDSFLQVYSHYPKEEAIELALNALFEELKKDLDTLQSSNFDEEDVSTIVRKYFEDRISLHLSKNANLQIARATAKVEIKFSLTKFLQMDD